MAQTGYTPILIYSSSTASNLPSASNLTNSTLGSELAINIADGKLFYKDTSNAVQVIGWKVTPTSAGGTGLTSYAAGDMLYYASGTTFTKLAIGATGRYMSSSGTAPQWTAPAALTKTDDTNVTLTLGGSASTALLNAASLTLGWTGTLATTRGGTGLSSFTANGVFYATSTSAIGQSANLTFDGTTLATNGLTSNGLTASGEIISTTNNARFSLYRSAGTNYFDWASGQSLYFSTQTSQGGAGRSTKVAFFDSGGVSIGNTTDPGASNLFVTGSVLCGGSSTSYGNLSSQTTSAAGYAVGSQTSGAGASLYGGWSGTTNVYAVFGNGDVVNTNNSYGPISDVKLKENIVDATPKLDDLMKVRVVNYNLKQELGFEPHKQIGVIAQELEEIFPGLVDSHVDTDEDGNQLDTQTKSVKMTVFIPMLIKAIQEQQQIIEQLKAKVGL